jgi:hypothetical protein
MSDSFVTEEEKRRQAKNSVFSDDVKRRVSMPAIQHQLHQKESEGLTQPSQPHDDSRSSQSAQPQTESHSKGEKIGDTGQSPYSHLLSVTFAASVPQASMQSPSGCEIQNQRRSTPHDEQDELHGEAVRLPDEYSSPEGKIERLRSSASTPSASASPDSKAKPDPATLSGLAPIDDTRIETPESDKASSEVALRNDHHVVLSAKEVVDFRRSVEERIDDVIDDVESMNEGIAEDIGSLRDEVADLTRLMHQLLERFDAEEKY